MQQWNGLLFEIPKNQTRSVLKDLSLMNFPNELNPENYVLGHVENHRCQYNWKTFIEVYLEDYHVEPFHPGLGRFVSCTNLSWQFGETFSVQTVGLQDLQRRAGSSTYQNWHEQVTRFFGAKLPEFGAIWLTYYPTVMVEFYPGVLTVSTLHPISPQETLNTVEFYYPEEIALFEPEFMKTQQAAYMETCIEDDEIAERMDAGRQALMRRGESEVGPYQTPMEDGMKHFHEWYRKAMDFV
jgi:phenylpropionate dioxygenase-like ring-hydroxylating dioxygenase large terminal subunit